MKQNIDSILLANRYLTKCQVEMPLKKDLAMKYLSLQIDKVLNEMKKKSDKTLITASIF